MARKEIETSRPGMAAKLLEATPLLDEAEKIQLLKEGTQLEIYDSIKQNIMNCRIVEKEVKRMRKKRLSLNLLFKKADSNKADELRLEKVYSERKPKVQGCAQEWKRAYSAANSKGAAPRIDNRKFRQAVIAGSHNSIKDITLSPDLIRLMQSKRT
mmetsp:Transcript_6323/g.7974  ORF Transcript_6323/g.7974 Transcript_6323/m.7974 type:complete len:156 (+) Transcript_6323:467-934(+)|eukprot:CAMPEP_0204827044 /NCGR_PEP_ID=MMETSP1346-20131115/4610_1 /ASSEMBLY_ACC=CAM_ASM_000771 /TAXON_ID=215587 /ORGANISM="Aplanochytrium stocchinoi, Strain GSBS06" /LENGTH=155 /DNA_ID=CAMNT_0051955337 /DNA_START=401 /DNA_END=868 /DNA_ORIENTATION=-